MKWISVKDRLPEEGQSILMIDVEIGTTLPTVGWYEKQENGIGFFTADHCLRLRLLITHWMPLAEPPE